MSIRLYAICLFSVLSLFSLRASDPTDLSLIREVPFIPLGTLQQIVGPKEAVWDWKWKQLDLSKYDPKIKQQVELDVRVTLSLPGEHPKWYQSPIKLNDILSNPARPFIYFVFIPESEPIGSLDHNLVYVYDTHRESLIFKTYADPEMDYRDFR